MGIVVRAARAAERAFKRATKWAKHRRVVLGPARKIGETSPQFYTRGDLCSPPICLRWHLVNGAGDALSTHIGAFTVSYGFAMTSQFPDGRAIINYSFALSSSSSIYAYAVRITLSLCYSKMQQKPTRHNYSTMMSALA